MKTGIQNIDNKVYYLGSNGAMQIGWINAKGDWYYFDESGDGIKGCKKIGRAHV